MNEDDSIDIHKHPKLGEFRKLIDELDMELLELFARRIAIVKDVGAYKKLHNLPALDEQRWQSILQTRTAKARSLNLSAEFMFNLFELIHKYTLKVESDIKDE
jgi:chorismate mutase